MISCKRIADKSKKLVKTSTATFPLWCHLNLLKKKVVPSLSSHRPVDKISTRLKIEKLQQ